MFEAIYVYKSIDVFFFFLFFSLLLFFFNCFLLQAEFTQLEQKMMEAKRSRDRTLTRMKKQAERQKEMAEKTEKRARATLQTDDATQGISFYSFSFFIFFRGSTTPNDDI